MPRDYYIKINLFKYPSVVNQPLNHLVDKSVNQSIRKFVTNSVANTNNKWSSNHLSDFDAQIMTHYVTTPDCDGSKSCGLICFWFDH